MALVDALVMLPADGATIELRERASLLLAGIVARQTKTGLWMQVLDKPDLAGNYEETSASAMFALCLTAGCAAAGAFAGRGGKGGSFGGPVRA